MVRQSDCVSVVDAVSNIYIYSKKYIYLNIPRRYIYKVVVVVVVVVVCGMGFQDW